MYLLSYKRRALVTYFHQAMTNKPLCVFKNNYVLDIFSFSLKALVIIFIS